jgi:hypothetical protein
MIFGITFSGCSRTETSESPDTQNPAQSQEGAASSGDEVQDSAENEKEANVEEIVIEEAVAADEIYYVNAEIEFGINVRSEPSTADAGNKILYIEAGDLSVRLDDQGEKRAVSEGSETFEWFKVKIPDGRIGWVRGDLVYECSTALETTLIGQWEGNLTYGQLSSKVVLDFQPFGLVRMYMFSDGYAYGSYAIHQRKNADFFLCNFKEFREMRPLTLAGQIENEFNICLISPDGSEIPFKPSSINVDWPSSDSSKSNLAGSDSAPILTADSEKEIRLISTKEEFLEWCANIDMTEFVKLRQSYAQAAMQYMNSMDEEDKVSLNVAFEKLRDFTFELGVNVTDDVASQTAHFGYRTVLIEQIRQAILSEFFSVLEDALLLHKAVVSNDFNIGEKTTLISTFLDADVVSRLYEMILSVY